MSEQPIEPQNPPQMEEGGNVYAAEDALPPDLPEEHTCGLVVQRDSMGRKVRTPDGLVLCECGNGIVDQPVAEVVAPAPVEEVHDHPVEEEAGHAGHSHDH